MTNSLDHYLETSSSGVDPTADEIIPIPRQHHLKERASDEFKRFLVIFPHLWAFLACCPSTRSFVLSQRHLNYREHAFAFVNAFIFAKVLLVADRFNLGLRSRGQGDHLSGPAQVLPVYCGAHPGSGRRGRLGGTVGISPPLFKQPFGRGRPHSPGNLFALCMMSFVLSTPRLWFSSFGAGDRSQRAVGFDSQA